MALNLSGPISIAGTTAGQSIQIELNGNGTTQMSLNDASVRTLAGVPSGAIIMPTNFYGKSNRVTAAATISSPTSNYTVDTSKAPGYTAGTTDFTLTINGGVFITSGSTGSYAMTVDTSWAAGDTVAIINNGTIVGRGGTGGQGSRDFSGPALAGFPGTAGGPALLVSRAITLTNGSGRIAGGGGGGGGGAVGSTGEEFPAGGGGGGGIGNGPGGPGGTGGFASGSPGSPGTESSAGGGGPGGGGGAGPGGTGGGYGSSGSNGTATGPGGGPSSGGGAGGCIVGNSNITYSGPTGNRNGSIS
jgi:hypothetical protein